MVLIYLCGILVYTCCLIYIFTDSVSSLRMLKEQQLSEVQGLRDQKESLTDAARDLAEKYEDVCEKNEGLISRSVSFVSITCSQSSYASVSYPKQ